MSILVWLLPVLSGLGDAISRGVIKLTRAHRFTLVAAGHLLSLPYFAAWLVIEGIPEVDPQFWLIVGCFVPLLVIAEILTVEAHRASPMILTAPYLTLTPALLLITSPIMGGGSPSSVGVVGVIAIVIGVYLLNVRPGQTGLLEPFANLKTEKGSRLMCVVAAIFAITANLDYLGLESASAPFYLLVGRSLAGFFVLVCAFGYSRVGRTNRGKLSPAGSWRVLTLFGAVNAFIAIPQFLGLELIPVVPYVIAGKRTGMIIFTVGIGLLLAVMRRFKGRYAEEAEHLRYRVPGTLIMIAGMLLIILFGRQTS